LGQKDWISEYVKLQPDLRGWNLTTHQWRKSFALFMVRTDSRLLRAVSNHFKHLSLAMTEQSYMGNDPTLLGMLKDVALDETARVLYEISSDGTHAAGRCVEGLAAHLNALQRKLTHKSEEAQTAEMRKLVADDNVRVWSCDWGWCFFRSETARCHALAGSIDMRADHPHFGKRAPGICCNCANLVVLDEHGEFWRRRYAQSLEMLKANKDAGFDDVLDITQERIRQCEYVLHMLGLLAQGERS
jgi:hypothetical protein